MRHEVRATYRLQLRPGFGFDAAAAVAPYLAELGVSHAYTSPYLQAAPGSTHGYDVVDHGRVNDELGGADAHRRWVASVRSLGLGQVVDLVPNHMAIGPRENRWWWDVLENGRSSRFAGHFDVDWDPSESRPRNRLLMPILGDHYGRVLERGEIELVWRDRAGFEIRYFDHELPVAPRSLAALVERAGGRCTGEIADQMRFIGRSLARLPSLSSSSDDDAEARHRDKEVLLGQLARLAADHPDVIASLQAEVDGVNGDVEVLDSFLDQQNFRLAFWRTAGDELDYRRFFDISTLIGVRVEAAEVFGDTHHLVLRWLADGEVAGVRIDHPDGLRDPQAYFDLLRAAAPDAWIVVEKILEPGEELPGAWPVDGTTGYDFCHVVTRLLHDGRGEQPIRDLYVELTGDGRALADVAYDAKVEVLIGALSTDVSRVTSWFRAVADEHRRWRDFTRRELHEAVVETAASFPVYRTYVGPDGTATDRDLAVIVEACASATERRPDLDPELFELLGLILSGAIDPGPGPATELRLRFQQLTGPVMAKGVEDTAFYDWVPLVSLNEVGSDPAQFAMTPGDFHESMAEAAARRPRSMLALSTHDTKRSEDVRARLAVLSEIPGAWAEAVRRWNEMIQPHREVGSGVPGWPDVRMEYLLFQTMVGAHPIAADRLTEYLAKATKEAKRNTSWTNPVAEYDEAVRTFVTRVCANHGFMSDLADFVDSITDAGWVNALAQKLVCLTAPGIPDIYQGTELWDLSLVDPDNRRPVDYDARGLLLTSLIGQTPDQVWAGRVGGGPKLLTVARALRLRADHPGWFSEADYAPLSATGLAAGHVIAFVRGGHAITVVPRLPLGLEAGGGWRDTELILPDGVWHDALSGSTWHGGPVEMRGLLGRFPVALLHDGGVHPDRGSTTRGGA